MESNQNLRFLIIEPQVKLRGFVKFGLEGFMSKNKLLTASFEEAASAEEARALIDKHRYDAVLCNPVLETEDAGIELVRHIRSHSVNGDTLILGTSRELDNATLMLAAGANDYIPLDYASGYNPLAHISKVLQKQLVEKESGFASKLEQTQFRLPEPEDPDVTRVKGSGR